MPSDPEDLQKELNDDKKGEVYMLCDYVIDNECVQLYIRPDKKHIIEIKLSEEDQVHKIIWYYKYEKGKWSIPSENEINGIDAVDENYVKYSDYSKLEPEKHRNNIKSKLDFESLGYSIKELGKELGLV